MTTYLLSDVDQTLICLDDWHPELWVMTAHALGKTHITLADVNHDYRKFLEYVGVSNEEFWTTLDRIDPRTTLEGTIGLVKAGKIKKYSDTDIFITKAKELELKIGLISDNPKALYELIALGIEDIAQGYMFWDYSDGYKLLKPGTILTRELLKILEYQPPDKIIMFGDNDIDMELGRNLASELSVPVTTIQHNSGNRPSKSADYICQNLKEAADVLEMIVNGSQTNPKIYR